MITQRKHKIICQLFLFCLFLGDIFSTVFPLPLSGPLLSRPAHRLVAVLGSPFCFSPCWICLLDPMTSSFSLYCPFFCFCQSVPATKNFLGKGAWSKNLETLQLRKCLYSWLIGNLESMLKVFFPKNFKGSCPLSYSICYSCEISHTILLHGICFYTLEAFRGFFLLLTFRGDVWVFIHSFIHSCWWVLDLVESVNRETSSILGNFLCYLFDNFLSFIFCICCSRIPVIWM